LDFNRLRSWMSRMPDPPRGPRYHVIHEDRVVRRLSDARVPGRARQMPVVLPHLSAQPQSLPVLSQRLVIGQPLTTRSRCPPRGTVPPERRERGPRHPARTS
jgi:hypothetical protein